jgi:hypothetical protein
VLRAAWRAREALPLHIPPSRSLLPSPLPPPLTATTHTQLPACAASAAIDAAELFAKLTTSTKAAYTVVRFGEPGADEEEDDATHLLPQVAEAAAQMGKAAWVSVPWCARRWCCKGVHCVYVCALPVPSACLAHRQ